MSSMICLLVSEWSLVTPLISYPQMTPCSRLLTNQDKGMHVERLTHSSPLNPVAVLDGA